MTTRNNLIPVAFGTLAIISIAAFSFHAGTQWNARQDIPVTPSARESSNATAEVVRVTEWARYDNEEFGFSIAYPSDLTLRIQETDSPPTNRDAGMQLIGDFAFVGAFEKGVMGVRVYEAPAEMDHIAAWLRVHTDNIQQEAIRTIAGKFAAIMYSVGSGPGDFEAFPYSKRAYLVSEDRVFEIVTQYFSDPDDYEYVWDSFKFTP